MNYWLQMTSSYVLTTLKGRFCASKAVRSTIRPKAYSNMAFKSFIITFKDNVADADASKIKSSISSLGGNIVHEYSLIKGFAVKLPESVSIDKVKNLHGHSFANVEEDQEVKAS